MFIKIFLYLLILQKFSSCEKKTLEGDFDFLSFLSGLWSTTKKSETHIPRNNWPFVTIIKYIITLMSRSVILSIENVPLILSCRETNCWIFPPWTEIWHHIQQSYVKNASIIFSEIEIYNKVQKLSNFW